MANCIDFTKGTALRAEYDKYKEALLYLNDELSEEQVDNILYEAYDANNGNLLSQDKNGNELSDIDIFENNIGLDEYEAMTARIYTLIGEGKSMMEDISDTSKLKKIKAEKDNNKSLANSMIEIFDTLLRDKSNYGNVNTPLDDDSQENFVNFIDSRSSSSEESNPLDFLTGRSQYDIKESYKFAKMGVALSANQASDHPATITYKTTEGAERELITHDVVKILADGTEVVLDEKTDMSDAVSFKFVKRNSVKEGRLVSTTLSTNMNGFVDAANNPWIVKANMNSSTYAIAAYLFRQGYQMEAVFAFMMHPLVKDISKIDEAQRNPSLYDSKKLDNLIEKFNVKYGLDSDARTFDDAKFFETYPKFNDIYEMLPDVAGKTNATFDEIFPSYNEIDKALARNKDKINNYNKIKSFIALYNSLKKNSSELQAEMKVVSTLTKGAGINESEYMNSVLNYGNAMYKSEYNMYRRLSMNSQLSKGVEVMGTMSRVMNSVTNSYDDKYLYYVLDIVNGYGIRNSLSPKKLEEFQFTSRMLTSTARANAVPELYHKNPTELFTGENNVAKQLLDIKEDKNVSNMFVDALKIDASSGKYNFIYTSFGKNGLTPQEKGVYADEFQKLSETHPEFVENLIKLSMYQTGLNSTRGNFNDILPESLLYKLSKTTNGLNDVIMSGKYIRNEIADNIKLNNHLKLIESRSDLLHPNAEDVNGRIYTKHVLDVLDKSLQEVAMDAVKESVGLDELSDEEFRKEVKDFVDGQDLVFIKANKASDSIIKVPRKEGYNFFKKISYFEYDTINPNNGKKTLRKYNTYAKVDALGASEGGYSIYEMNLRGQDWPSTEIAENKWDKDKPNGYRKNLETLLSNKLNESTFIGEQLEIIINNKGEDNSGTPIDISQADIPTVWYDNEGNERKYC